MKRRNFLIVVLLITLVAVWYAYTEYNRTAPNLAQERPVTTLTALELLAQAVTDSAKAAAQYTGTVIAVSGTVKKLDSTGTPVVVFLGDANQMSSVQCSMDDAGAANDAALRVGKQITVKGEVAGIRSDPLFGTDVILDRCVFTSN